MNPAEFNPDVFFGLHGKTQRDKRFFLAPYPGWRKA